MSIDQLYKTICSRRDADPITSYTASLFAGGSDKLAQKLGEESVELIIAAGKMEDNTDAQIRQAFIGEAADLMYHYLALLAWFDISPDDIASELGSRSGRSGIAEKKERSQKTCKLDANKRQS